MRRQTLYTLQPAGVTGQLRATRAALRRCASLISDIRDGTFGITARDMDNAYTAALKALGRKK